MTYFSEVDADAPAAWYRGDGTTADEVTGGVAGVLTNGATYGPSTLPNNSNRQAFLLDGVDDYVSVADQAKLDLVGSMTLEAWVTPETIDDAFHAIAMKGVSATSTIYGIQLNAGAPELQIRTDVQSNRATSPTPLVSGRAYHIAGTVSGTTQRLYVDGVEVATNTIVGTLSTNTQPLRIGSFNGSSEFFHGRIGDVAIYPTALSAARVKAHYDAGKAATSVAPSPVVRWNGTTEVPQKVLRGNGATLLEPQQIIGGAAITPPPSDGGGTGGGTGGWTPQLVTLSNMQEVSIAGRRFRTQCPNQPWSVKADLDPAPNFLQAELRNGDKAVNDGRQRCEMRELTRTSFGVPYWWAYSIRWFGTLPSGSYHIITQFNAELGTAQEETLTQRHAATFSLGLERAGNGGLNVYIRGDTNYVGKTDPSSKTVWSVSPPAAGQVVHLVFRSVFSKATANGELDIWMNGGINGAPNYSGRNLVNAYNDDQGPYFKFGSYRWPAPETTTVQFANPEFGRTSLADRIANPLPLPAGW